MVKINIRKILMFEVILTKEIAKPMLSQMTINLNDDQNMKSILDSMWIRNTELFLTLEIFEVLITFLGDIRTAPQSFVYLVGHSLKSDFANVGHQNHLTCSQSFANRSLFYCDCGNTPVTDIQHCGSQIDGVFYFTACIIR